MKHVVNFSGGLCSFWAAHRVVSRYGSSDVTLLFADTLVEDPDLYVFNQQCSTVLGVRLTTVTIGLTPWELFRRQGMIGNNCGGRCVRAGISHWVHLYHTLPERFLEWEHEELETQAHLKNMGRASDWYSILRDRRGGETKTMTLWELRHRIEAGDKFTKIEWGGCGCGGSEGSAG